MAPAVLVLGSMLGVATAVWGQSVGELTALVGAASLPSGQGWYLVSKWAALSTLFVLLAHVVLMAMKRLRLAPGRHWRRADHRLLGLAVSVLVLVHVGAFVAASSLRSGHPTWHLLTPRFLSGYYDSMVSVGLLALCLGAVVVTAGAVGSGRWRRLHGPLIAPFVLLCVLHSYAIGSETTATPVLFAYLALSGAALAAAFVRWRGSRTLPAPNERR